MITCGHCKGQHATVAEVRACSAGGGVLTAERPPQRYGDGGNQIFNPGGPATDRAKDYARKLLADREIEAVERQKLLNLVEQDGRAYVISRIIDSVKALPRRSKPSGGAVDQDGMYRDPGTGEIFKVQKAVHGSGELYAKRLEIQVHTFGAEVPGDGWFWSTEIPLPASREDVPVTDGFRFVYVPGLIRRIKPEWRMSLEQAKHFGALYGTCCVCGRTLTNEDSIEAGIGPICAGRV